MADAGVVETLLQRVEKVDDGVDSLDVASSLGVDHQVIVGAVKSLQCLGEVRFPGSLKLRGSRVLNVNISLTDAMIALS